MTNVTPLISPPADLLRNALWIAELGIDAIVHIDHEQEAAGCLAEVVNLLKAALEGLSEPNLASVQATAILLREARNELPGVADEPRYARDTAAAILHAAVTGVVPGTCSGAVG